MSPYRKAVPSWAAWIKDYLLGLPDKEDYVFHIYKEYNAHLKANNYKEIAFSSFVGYIWLLKQLGGLELTRTEPAHVTRESPDIADYLYTVDAPPKMHIGGVRHYYHVVPGTEYEGYWHSPRLKWAEITGRPRG